MEDKDFVPLTEPTDAGIDLPDDRDWQYSDIMELKEEETGGNVEIDIEVIKKKLSIFNQGARRETKNACGEYGLRHCDNAQHLFVDGTQVDPFDGWVVYQDQRDSSVLWKGTSLQGNLARFKNTGIISGYALVNSINDAKKAIDNRNFIYTGSNNGDWASVRDNKLYKVRTDGKIVGHLICVVGYDDDGFIGLNSYGPDNGYFTIPYHLWNKLYSRYAIFGLSEQDLLLTYRAMKTIEEAVKVGVELGITNGERLKDNLTREEGITMTIRLYDLVKELIANK